MKCIDIKEKLDVFADAEIEAAEKKKVEDHLKNCAGCKTELENLQLIGKTLKQHLYVSAPASLDKKVSADFQNFHGRKRDEKSENKKAGWFGIPRFAFAAMTLLFAVAVLSAFQVGRMSVGEKIEVMSPVRENNSFQVKSGDTERFEQLNSAPVKIVEVPVIKEKIVKVPVIKNRIVYVNRNGKTETPRTVSADENLALKSSVENNGYLTRTNLRDFQPVSEIKFKINKEEK